MNTDQKLELLIEEASELPEEARVAPMHSLAEMRGQAVGIDDEI